MIKNDNYDWAMGELMAYATLSNEGHAVRMTGQDVERGTFSHRHAIIKQEDSELSHNIFDSLGADKKAHVEFYNSLLSEYAVLGFEYGFSMLTPNDLTIWEAQFGDFANGAQIIIDQYISSAEAKWKTYSGLVMMLPHGYEGQGPEHSSARLERFLQLCANWNIQVCNITTPANYFHALRDLTKGAKRIGIEFDHVNLDLRRELENELPGVEFVDIAAPSMRQRMIKSDEEIVHITKMTRIADLGGAACVEAIGIGVPEHEVALHSTQAMVREIARIWPDGELMDTWTWFQSGINTDGAHNPVTSRKIEEGDILSLNCFPMVAGYYVALERTLFAGHASREHQRLWEINCHVHDEGKKLLVPGARCSDIARQLNDIYAGHQLLQYRTFGYGHSFGVLCHYYGREGGLELREDCDTVLAPGMVISMEPMIMVPEGRPGAGGYREHDILVITEDGNRNITGFPYGPEHLIIKK
jgi:creatinase